MADDKVMRMYYDKNQANTQITVAEWDQLRNNLKFEMDIWSKKISQKTDESKKDYYKRLLEKVTEQTDDPLIKRVYTEGRLATLELLSNPETPVKVLDELRSNLLKLNQKQITTANGTIAVFRGINPEELKKIEREAIRAHLAAMREEENKTSRAKKMNVH